MIQEAGFSQRVFREAAYKQKSGPTDRNIQASYSAIETRVQTKPEGNNSTIWNELSQKYDVRNAAIEEIGDISMKLYDAKQISLSDHAILSFDPGKSPQQIKGTIFLTPANSRKRDWIAEYRARAEQALKLGDTQSYSQYKHIGEILERLSH